MILAKKVENNFQSVLNFKFVRPKAVLYELLDRSCLSFAINIKVFHVKRACSIIKAIRIQSSLKVVRSTALLYEQVLLSKLLRTPWNKRSPWKIDCNPKVIKGYSPWKRIQKNNKFIATFISKEEKILPNGLQSR